MVTPAARPLTIPGPEGSPVSPHRSVPGRQTGRPPGERGRRGQGVWVAAPYNLLPGGQPVKYRLEYDPARAGAPRWEFFQDFPSRAEARQAEKTLRRRFGATTRSRITPVADDAPTPAVSRPD